jgi:hypothetical protein
MSGPATEKLAVEESDAATAPTTSERPLHEYVADVSERTDVQVGVPLPLGTYARGDGVNFAFFSRHASRVRLELFDHPEDARAARVIDLDSTRNRTGDVWHVWIEGIGHGQLYAYRVDGPYQPREGHRFNFNNLLLDPFATAIAPLPDWDFGAVLGYDVSAPERDLACSKVDDGGAMPAGPSGMAATATMSAASGVATMGCSVHLPAASAAAQTFMPKPVGVPRAASISSPVTMASRCMIW